MFIQVNSKKDIKCNQAQRTPHKIKKVSSYFVRSFIYNMHFNFATFVFKRKHAAIVTEYDMTESDDNNHRDLTKGKDFLNLKKKK